MKNFVKFFIVATIILSAVSCFADIPHLINYQGKLADTTGKPVTDGTYSVTFRIYDTESAGTLLWEETQSVSISRGIFSVMLGGVTALNLAFDKPYWLEIKVGTEVMSPRQRMASVGYAYAAQYGVPRGVIVMWSGKIADIPKDWALCDGSNGTPDLRNRFIIGATQDDSGVAKTNVTGPLTQIGDGQIPAHTHAAGTLTGGAHTHEECGNSAGAVLTDYVGGTDMYRYSIQSLPQSYDYNPHVSTKSGGVVAVTGSTGSAGSGTKNIATYYALAYIIKL